MFDPEAILQASQLLTDPLRLQIITLLLEGPVTVNELTVRTCAPQPRVSSHLAILRKAGWAQSSSYGQQRRYELTSPRIGEILTEIAAIQLVPQSRKSSKRVRTNTAHTNVLRAARTCYTHLAGQAGVALCDGLRDKGWIVPVENGAGAYQPGFDLTALGRTELLTRGVVIPREAPRKPLGYACPDWMEPGPHLGGALGAAIFNRFEHLGLVSRVSGSRALMVEGDLLDWLEEETVG